MLSIFKDRTSPPRLWLIALALWFAVTAISAIALWHLRENAFASQWRETNLLSLALADGMDHGLHGVEQGLSAMREEFRDNGFLPLSSPATEQILSRRTKLMPLARTLWLVDHQGQLVSASDKTALPDLSSFYPPLDKLADDATAISRPFTDVRTKESLVAMAVSVRGATDNSSGWVLAGFPATALFGAFSVASPGQDARMAVFRDDGVRLVGRIIDTPTLDEATVAQLLANRPSMEVHKFRDGSKRLMNLRSLPRYGLKLILTRDLEVALKPWRETAQIAGAGIILLLLILIISVRLVARADQRNAAAQHALQTQLSRASQLESLGTLAGAVAHDFNNVLAAIIGFGEMAQDAAPKDSRQQQHLDRVLQAAVRGKQLIERILTFSRGGAHHMVVFELEPIIDEVLTLLAASLRHGIVLERRIETPRARLRGDPTQAFEAIMNLCTNAMQAMSDGGGVLRVHTKRVLAATPCVLSHSQLAVGNYLLLTVSDEGAGIRPEVMERLFQPFFTTRGALSGTGLGLAVVHGVVAEFGGAIDVQSTPGKGSRFMLYFPECTDAVETAEAPPKETSDGTGQSLMVVDDDPALLSLAEEILKGLGYEPVGYSDPAVAMAVLRANPQRFAALITDEVMPGLCGTKFTEALRKFAPELPVLLISGYGGACLTTRATAAGVTRVLAKPLRRADLAQALSELLASAPTGKA